jgi:hypothetical protein
MRAGGDVLRLVDVLKLVDPQLASALGEDPEFNPAT